jgi:DNA adenine methylase
MGSYFGSKATSGLCQPIIAMMPPHDTFIETHLGVGAIMKRKPAALHNIGIDRNPRALANFQCDYPVPLVHGCAHRFLAEQDYRGGELIYCDPPYLLQTRSSARRYRFDYQEPDHIEPLELLKGLACNVMLSGYPSRLYEDLLQGWNSLQLQVMNLGQTIQALIGKAIAEATILNDAMQLHLALEAWEQAAIEQLLRQPAIHVATACAAHTCCGSG